MRSLKLIKVFIASPSDTELERTICQKVIDELNNTIGRSYKLKIESLMWENNIYPAIGDYPQDVINKQIGDDYNIFVGIMWKKFGLKTPKADSATEEEFNRAHDRYIKDTASVELMFYFKRDPLPQDSDLKQFQKVKNFKDKVSKKGICYKEFESKDFEQIFRVTLHNCIHDKFCIHVEGDFDSQCEGVCTPVLSEALTDFINRTEVNYTHPKVDTVCLDDIYVPPFLKDITNVSGSVKKISATVLSDAIESVGIKFLICGGENSGKTSLCKYFFKQYFQSNLNPIILNGVDLTSNVRKDNIQSIIKRKVKEQYNNEIRIGDSIDSNKDILLIIDDFHKAAKGNERYWKLLVNNIESMFLHVIIIGDLSLNTIDLSAYPPFDDYCKYSLMEFGPKLRNVLIRKWYILGIDEPLESRNEILHKIDEVSKQINTIIGKNYIPAYPFYILGMLQQLEIGKSGETNYSIHGFYYEMLINSSFARSIKDPKEISFYYNFLTSLCYYMFEKQERIISIEEFTIVYESYCERHDVIKEDFGFEKIKKTFKDAKLLLFNHNVKTSNDYVYYFFVAKFLANNIEKEDVKDIISKLSIRIFRDEYAGILMFITHLSKNEWIINEIISNANHIFENADISLLESDVDNVNKLILELPKQVIELVDINVERNAQLDLDEELEQKQREFDEDTVNYSEFSLDDDVSTIDFLSKMNLALKTIDILGQVAKKYWGELSAETKFTLAQATYNLGLRALKIYLELVSENQKEIAEYIRNLVFEKHIKEKYKDGFKEGDAIFFKDKIEKSTKSFIIGLSYLASWGIIKRISNSIGYDKLGITFDKILENCPYNSVRLINLSIDLNCKGLPMKDIEKYSIIMESNKMCYKLLQDLVIDHMYMFDVEYRKKAQLGTMLKIDIKSHQ